MDGGDCGMDQVHSSVYGVNISEEVWFFVIRLFSASILIMICFS